MLPVTSLGRLDLPWYGVLLLTGLALGTLVLAREARRRGYSGRVAFAGARWVILGALLGAHLPYWLLGLLGGAEERWSGAASYHGALAGGGLSLVLFVLRRGLPLLTSLDVAAFALTLGHGIGRLGCFLAGCCWGAPTDLPWGVVFTHERCFAPTGVSLHPTQLYEFGLEMSLFAYLGWRRLRPHAAGTIAFTYGLVFGAGRFVVEFFRDDSGRGRLLGGALSLTQGLSLLLLACSIAGLVWISGREPDLRQPDPSQESS